MKAAAETASHSGDCLGVLPFHVNAHGFVEDATGARVLACAEDTDCSLRFNEAAVNSDGHFMCPNCGRLGQRMVEARPDQCELHAKTSRSAPVQAAAESDMATEAAETAHPQPVKRMAATDTQAHSAGAEAVAPATGSVCCPRCRGVGRFVRTRYFDTSVADVWECQSANCTGFGRIWHADRPYNEDEKHASQRRVLLAEIAVMNARQAVIDAEVELAVARSIAATALSPNTTMSNEAKNT